jgi:hypothetical protein
VEKVTECKRHNWSTNIPGATCGHCAAERWRRYAQHLGRCGLAIASRGGLRFGATDHCTCGLQALIDEEEAAAQLMGDYLALEMLEAEG